MPASISSASDISDGTEETWDDWIEEEASCMSLFDGESFPSAMAALQHDKQMHKVDLPLLASTLDFFERIRLINYIRKTKPAPASMTRLDRNAAFLQDDDLLKPVLEDDPLLQIDFDSLSLSDSAPTASTSTGGKGEKSIAPSESDLVEALRAQLSDSNQAMQQLKKIIQDRLGDSMGLDTVKSDAQIVVKAEGKGKGKEGKGDRDDDSHYFESYAYNEIHEIMLKDKIRTDAYRDFIMSNPSLFKDAVVLDVGCGTGILSMFAAKAGAKHVYAVDASAVAFKAERNIKANGLSEKISVVKGKVEEIELPEKVDIIISEWMGYFLLYECMLDSVLHARDRFMKPGGLMIPSQTSILISLFASPNLTETRIKFWDSVYGFEMKSMAEEIYDEALIDVVDGREIVSAETSLIDIRTGTVSVKELEFKTPFSLQADKSAEVNAFLGHFDTYFKRDGNVVDPTLKERGVEEGEVFFTTGAKGVPTHWKQTLFLLREPIKVVAGTLIQGNFSCTKNPENSRELIVEMTWTVKNDAHANAGPVKAQVWKVR